MRRVSGSLCAAVCVLIALPVGAAPTGPELVPAEALARRTAQRAGGLRLDPGLERAAGQHLAAVLADPSKARRTRVEAALAREGLVDAQFVPFVVLGSDPATLERTLLEFGDHLRPRGMTHLGVVWAQRRASGFGGEAQQATLGLAAIFSRRVVELAPLAARVEGERLEIRGRLRGPQQLEVLLLGPAVLGRAFGVLQSEHPEPTAAGVFSVALPLAEPGRYTVEILADAGRGPEVVALWHLGHREPASSSATPATPPREPKARAAALGQLAAAIAEVRRQAHLLPLAESTNLARAAAGQAQAVCASHRAAHVLQGSTPEMRARAAGFEGEVTENIAIAETALAAHQNLLESPAHLRNLIDPQAASLGLGLARGTGENDLPIDCVVEVFGRRAALR